MEEEVRMLAEMRMQGGWVKDEDVEDRIRWHSLIELGVLHDRHPSSDHGRLGEKKV